MFVVIACVKMPGKNDDKAPLAFRHTLKKLWDNVDYRLR